MGHGHYIDPFEDARSVPGMTSLCGDARSVPGMTTLCGDARSVPGMTSPVIAGLTGNLYQVQAGEVLNLQYVVLPGESRDLDVRVDLVGAGAQVDVKVLYLCGADEQVNIRTLVHHRAPGCRSTQLINGIAGGTAQVRFDGTIVVAPDAQQTEAYQENHNIVLGPEARVETKPQLEIYADDVKCSHGATVGQLNEDERFYMRSRGIPDQEARTLQMLSFLWPVIPQGREEEIEKAVREL